MTKRLGRSRRNSYRQRMVFEVADTRRRKTGDNEPNPATDSRSYKDQSKFLSFYFKCKQNKFQRINGIQMSIKSFVFYLFGAINSWSRLPFFQAPPDQSVEDFNPIIQFERLSTYWPHNFTNSVSAFQRQHNLARLNACGNSGTSFHWKFLNDRGDEVDNIKSTQCEIFWQAPKQVDFL